MNGVVSVNIHLCYTHTVPDNANNIPIPQSYSINKINMVL